MFKIGDRVRINESYEAGTIIGMTGTIVKLPVDAWDPFYRVAIDGTDSKPLLYPYELDHLAPQLSLAV